MGELWTLICEEFDLIVHTTILFPEPTFIKLPLVAIASESICYNYNNQKTEVCGMAVYAHEEYKEKASALNVRKLDMQNENNLTSSNILIQDSNCSTSVVSANKMCCEQYIALGSNSDANAVITTDDTKKIDKPDLESDNSSEIVVDVVVAVDNEDVEIDDGPKKRMCTMNLKGIREKEMNTVVEELVAAVSNVDVEIDGLEQKNATVHLEGIQEKNTSVGDLLVGASYNADMEIAGSKQIISAMHLEGIVENKRKTLMHLEGIVENKRKTLRKHNLLDSVPIWGFTSLKGRRSEMEDAVVAIPHFLELPVPMLSLASNALNQNLTHSSAHFFGVYDGHGGCQVANYCRDRIHLALTEELKLAEEHFHSGNVAHNWQEQWEKAFLRCFQKVNAEVAGVHTSNECTSNAEEHNLEAIASDAVGSTAVVTVVCSTHIIVANCGDSRAVLFRGKESVPLSTDHKPGRNDERTRIEAAGGMVIYWGEFRVSGVLAMSRSIGDRYLAPYVIPDPEIMFVSRAKEDELLILATDGLWDVVTNEEACDLARKRILLWHKKNGPVLNSSDEGTDPAQDAADYLSKLALQRGGKDNISIIVVDLKVQRKFKKKN